jgi:hypothetical protein
MGSLRRRVLNFSSNSSARGFTPLGEVESDPSGVLIAARSEASAALVDIRVLAPALKADRVFMRRLASDMDVLRDVRHTNLVSVMQFDKRAAAVVYESIPGGTLTQLLDAHGPLELVASLVLLEDTVSGLEALHKAGVRHGNLTPDAVVVETSGAVLLRDAGLAAPHADAGLLPEQQRYVAPEILSGAAPTSATDLYAATAIFVESIGGRASKTAVRTDLRPLLAEGMAKDPSKRSTTLDRFRHELDDFARATFGESWRKEGRALLTAAAAAQASRAIRVSSPSDVPSAGAADALALVALVRSPAPRDPRIWAGLGGLGFAALLAILVLTRGISANASPPSAGYVWFNGVPAITLPGTSTQNPTPGPVGPATSAGANGSGSVPAPITGPTTSPTGDAKPPPPPTPIPNPALQSQSITWTSGVPSGATYGGSFAAAASGGGSGNAVIFTSLTSAVCKPLAGNTFDYLGVGTCSIEASQAGNAHYNAATPRTMTFGVGQASQAISFTSGPSNPTYLGSYTVTASAAGGAVTFSQDPSSVACSVTPSGSVSFTAAGACVIDANQAGDTDYTPAQPLQQQFDVAQATQSIGFTSSAPACPCSPGQQYTVIATGGGSGNQVTFNIDPASSTGICTIAGSTVTLSGGLTGTCIIDAFQAGDQNYSAAAEVQQSISVS